jgi:hypothetical protein
MARIQVYPEDNTIEDSDKLVGTDGTISDNLNKTKNFTVGQLKQHITNGLGATGPQGVQGVAGPMGPQGVPGPIGPAGLEWQGTWDANVAYNVDDAVGYDGASYFCVSEVGLPLPGSGGNPNPRFDTDNWALLASRGITGPQGPAGANGATGPQGPIGLTGPAGTLPVQTRGTLGGSDGVYLSYTNLIYDINIIEDGSVSSFFKLPNVTTIGKQVIVDVLGDNCSIYSAPGGLAFETGVTTSTSQITAKFNDLIRFTSIGGNFWLVEYLSRSYPVANDTVVKTVKTTITTAQVLQLFTTPITVLPASLPGKLNIPTNIYIKRNPGTAYTLHTNAFQLLDASNIDAGPSINPNPLTSTSTGYMNNTIFLGISTSGATTTGLYKLKAVGANPTLGTGNLDVYVTYTEMTLF